MKKSNLFMYILENKVVFPYHEYSIELTSNVYRADQNDNLLGFITRLDESDKSVERIDEYSRFGSLFKVHSVLIKQNYLSHERTKVFTVHYTGITFARFKIITLNKADNKLSATVQIYGDQVSKEQEQILEKKQLVQKFKKEMKTFYECKLRNKEAQVCKAILDAQTSINKMTYRCAQEINLPSITKLKFLQMHQHDSKLQFLISTLTSATQNLRTVSIIEENVRQQLNQANASKRTRVMTVMNSSRGESDALSQRLKNKKLPQHVREEIMKELKRMGSESQQAVTMRYVETLLDIPWLESTQDVKDLSVAESILHAEHTGLKQVKERILQFLAVKFRKGNSKGNIICLHGPPGVGKTSIAKSIAKALNKEFTRVSLGGMNDQAELRGHRRTYVAALPGVIIRALIKAKSNNPVILLDEIEKIGSSYKGNPQHALLQILDPSQNTSFSDHYVSIPVDLSKVVFICTANSLELSAPLLNRLQLIQVPGYSRQQKLQIAQNHLLPLQLKENGVEDLVEFDQEALKEIIKYCNEMGVRDLERQIAKICRKGARVGTKMKVTKQDIETILGKRREHELVSGVGIVNGLAWTQLGGKVMVVEGIQYRNKSPKIEVTGQLGDVMKESVVIATSWIKAHLEDIVQAAGYSTMEPLDQLSLHIHFPSGATKKDGPSAGVAIMTCIASVLLKTPVRERLAMTGEITLSGRVLPVGGIREKCIAAIYKGIKHIIIPADNVSDLEKIDAAIKNNIVFHPVKDLKEVLLIAFPELIKPVPPKI